MKVSRLLLGALKMPPLEHYVGKREGKVFDVAQSKVLEWIGKQNELQEWVFKNLCERGLITYDESANHWSGAGELAVEVVAVDGENARADRRDTLLGLMKAEGVAVREWADLCLSAGIPHATFFRYRRKLLAKGLIRKEGRLWFRVNS
jgi:hypothetical protein